MTLYEDLHAELDRLTALAEAASPWRDFAEAGDIQYGDYGWYIVGSPMGEWEDSEQGKADAAFARSVANPSDALRRYAAARRVLERHPAKWNGEHEWCPTCWDAEAGENPLHPCPEIRDLAASLGIEVSP